MIKSNLFLSQHLTSCVLSQQRLEEYQRRLDISSLKQSENPMILELKVRNHRYSLILLHLIYYSSFY